MKKLFGALAAAALLFVGSTASALDIGNDGFIEVEGVEYPSPGENPNDARRLAILDAYRQLGESVGDLHISSESTVKQKLEQKSGKSKSERVVTDELNTKVNAVVNGAMLKSAYRDADGSFHAIVRLSVFGGAKSLANAVLPEKTGVEDFLKPKFTDVDLNYTGLIVDCSGLGLSTAILPSIKAADGTEIYAYKNISRQMAAERGMVSYSDSLETGVQRAGNNPLTVKAMFVSGECDAVVSDDDADKILAANQNSSFLKNCMVVFVR